MNYCDLTLILPGIIRKPMALGKKGLQKTLLNFPNSANILWNPGPNRLELDEYLILEYNFERWSFKEYH